jgi:CelD/BcsL family acetyltransferase involved in cellulose biosynthesis
MNDDWQLEAVPVRISLGEKTLFRPRLPLLVYQGGADAPLVLPSRPSAAGGFYVPSCPVDAVLPEIAVEHGMLRFASCYTRRRLSFAGSFEQYTKKWSSRSRGNLRRRVRDFAQRTGASPPLVRRFAAPDEIDALLAAIDAVVRRSYQSALLGSKVDEHFAALARDLAAGGRLVAHVLYDGERPVAYTFMSAQGRELLLLRLAYDDEYRALAPGMVLLLAVLEELFGEGRWALLDFGEGDAEYKTFLATDSALCAELFYLRFTPRNLAVMGLRRSLSGMTRAAVTVLERVGAKERVKRFLRRRAASY